MRYALLLGYSIHDFVESTKDIKDLTKEYPPDVTLVECEDLTITKKYQYIDGKFVSYETQYNSALLNQIRAKRDQLLLDSDKYMLPDYPTGTLTRDQWNTKVAEYRQALRDFPSNCNVDNPV